MPTLHVTLQDGTQTAFELTEDVITVGRLPDNALHLDDPSVSSHHAQLTSNGAEYVLQDLGSTNGTRFNGTPVEPNTDHPMRDGDRIRFGSVDAMYQSGAPSEARPMPAEQEPALAPSSTSVPPSDFANASPFPNKRKKKDPAGLGLIIYAVVAILAFVGAVVSITSMKPPM